MKRECSPAAVGSRGVLQELPEGNVLWEEDILVEIENTFIFSKIFTF